MLTTLSMGKVSQEKGGREMKVDLNHIRAKTHEELLDSYRIIMQREIANTKIDWNEFELGKELKKEILLRMESSSNKRLAG